MFFFQKFTLIISSSWSTRNIFLYFDLSRIFTRAKTHKSPCHSAGRIVIYRSLVSSCASPLGFENLDKFILNLFKSVEKFTSNVLPFFMLSVLIYNTCFLGIFDQKICSDHPVIVYHVQMPFFYVLNNPQV